MPSLQPPDHITPTPSVCRYYDELEYDREVRDCLEVMMGRVLLHLQAEEKRFNVPETDCLQVCLGPPNARLRDINALMGNPNRSQPPGSRNEAQRKNNNQSRNRILPDIVSGLMMGKTHSDDGDSKGSDRDDNDNDDSDDSHDGSDDDDEKKQRKKHEKELKKLKKLQKLGKKLSKKERKKLRKSAKKLAKKERKQREEQLQEALLKLSTTSNPPSSSPGGSGKPPAVIFDIDDTLLSQWPPSCQAFLGECKRCLSSTQWQTMKFTPEDEGDVLAPIHGTVRLFHWLRDHGVKCILLTGRYGTDDVYDFTLKNLQLVGIHPHQIEKLIMRNERHGEFDMDAQLYKTIKRKELARKYNILACIGDQDSDIEGGFAGIPIKLPNPMYRI